MREIQAERFDEFVETFVRVHFANADCPLCQTSAKLERSLLEAINQPNDQDVGREKKQLLFEDSLATFSVVLPALKQICARQIELAGQQSEQSRLDAAIKRDQMKAAAQAAYREQKRKLQDDMKRDLQVAQKKCEQAKLASKPNSRIMISVQQHFREAAKDIRRYYSQPMQNAASKRDEIMRTADEQYQETIKTSLRQYRDQESSLQTKYNFDIHFISNSIVVGLEKKCGGESMPPNEAALILCLGKTIVDMGIVEIIESYESDSEIKTPSLIQ